MVKWSKVISGFDSEDETTNFGTRNFAENNGSIYETWTLATIESESENENEIIQNPNVNATIWYDKMCVTIDSSLTIFSDQKCQDVLVSIGFDSLITSMCLSIDGTFLLVSIEKAILYCFALDSGHQIFNIDFDKEYNCSRIIKMFLHETKYEIDVMVIASNGNIYRISGIDKNLRINQTNDYHQIVKSIDLISTKSPIKYAEYINFDGRFDQSNSDEQISIVTVGDKLCFFPDGTSCNMKKLPYEYVKIQFLNDYKAMLCLRADGALNLVYMNTLLAVKILDGPIKSFLTIQETGNDSNQMLVLMAPKPSETSTSLHLMSFPDLNIIFTMSVSSFTYLVDHFDSTIDRLLFLEGMKNSNNSLCMIRIKAIEESMPEFRLHRLLRQRRFDKARAFANKFNLNTESVFQAEASMFMNRLRPQENTTEKVDLICLKTILDKITDVSFIYDCCNNTLTCNYKDTRSLLEYSRNRIVAHLNEHHELDNSKTSHLLHNVSGTLRKLETFEIIQKTKLNKQDNNSDDINEWNTFSKANLLDECIKYLALGELDAAALIWIRHTSAFAQKISRNEVTKILEAIPSDLQPSALWPWLRHFIPSVTSLLPSALAEILQWSCIQTKSYEIFHRDAWLDIGLKFANGLIELLHFDEYNICFQFHQQYAQSNSQFHQLIKLIQAMTELMELKSQYKIVLPLNIYLGEATNVINILLNKVHIDEIPKLMENFLQPYMLNNSLQNDTVLSNFIENTLRNSKDWWLWDKAPWEKRLITVIGYIDNIKNRLQQTLIVLKKAPVPWSDTLTQLVEHSYIYNHPLVTQIRFESNYVAEKLILKKYGFAHSRQCPTLFRNIVKLNRPSMIDDIFELTKTNKELRMSILYFCINYHLKQGGIQDIINIFQQLSDDIVVQCCQQLVYVIQSTLNFLTRQNDPSDSYMISKVLNLLERRLRELMPRILEDSIQLDRLLETILNLRNLNRLNNELNICIDMNTYIENKKNVMLNYLKKLIDEIATESYTESKKVDWVKIFKNIEKANELLRLSKLFGLYNLLEIYKDSTELKSNLLLYLSENKVIFEEETYYANKICKVLIEIPVDDSKSAAHLRNLFSRSLLSSKEKYLEENIHLGRYINSYSDAIDSQIRRNDSPFDSSMNDTIQIYPLYQDACISSGSVLLPLLQDGIKICSFYRDKTQQNDSESQNEDAIELLSKSFSNRVKALQNEYHDFSLLKIITAVYFELCSYLPASKISTIEIQVNLHYCAYTLLKKVIGSRIFDMHLGLICLFLLPSNEQLKSLISISKLHQVDYARNQVANDLGYEYCRLKNDIKYLERFQSQRILHYWGQKLVSYGISYREVLHSDTEKKRDILRCIMQSNKADTIEVLRDFCNIFGFNADDCYLSYLKTCLSSWQPKYSISTINNDQNELKINQDDVKQLTTMCTKITDKIIDKVAMKYHLAQMVSRINFYHYEIFLIVLELAEESRNETKCHLCFLQNYTRISTPTDIEYEEWGKVSQENESLPAISKWRLPFLPKMDQYKLVTPELNLKTYEKWLTIADVLKIPIHNICTLAVKGTVTNAWKINSDDSEKNSAKWSINLRNSALLKDIKRCIDYMPGKDGLHYATAALYYVVNHTPPGADLVAAAKECFIYSERWQQESDESDLPTNNKLLKIKKKFLKYSSKHVLHTHGLGQEKYLNLVDNPEKLVRELYKNETIPYRYKHAISNRPDINSAVNTLGNIFTLNLVKIRLELLNEWLQPWNKWDNKNNDSITTNFTQDFTSSTSSESFALDDNFLRACYIVSSGHFESYVNYLIGIAFPDDRDYCLESGIRFRALRVLQSITDEKTLQNYVKRDTNTINQYMKTLQYLSELEGLGLGYSVSGFNECSKHKLVQILISSQYSSPRALRLIPQLYMDFKIDDYSLLVTAIEHMVKLSLIKELKKILLMLRSIDCITNADGYITAWQIVVADPFNKLDIHSGTETIENCIESLRLLHACPVIDKLDFSNIINYCIKAKRWYLAATFLPYINDNEDKNIILKQLQHSENLNEIIAQLMELETKGILIARQTINILQASDSRER